MKEKDLCGIPWRLAFALQDDGWWLRQDNVWHKPNPMPESVEDRTTRSHEFVFHLSKAERYFYDGDAIAEPFQTDPKENYPARAMILGRGDQLFADARGNDRDKSGGFPPRSRAVLPRHSSYDSSNRSSLEKVERGGQRNKRSVWTVATVPSSVPHFATYPPALIEPCILAGCPQFVCAKCGTARDNTLSALRNSNCAVPRCPSCNAALILADAIAPGTVLDPFIGVGTTAIAAERLARNCIGIELSPKYAQIAERRAIAPGFPLEPPGMAAE